MRSPLRSPRPSLILERLPDRLRLYLGGDLQFDTQDEAIYHERLAHPALAVVEDRFDGPLDVVVLGGGDGLLAREILRHACVRSVTLIDLNPEVLTLARSELAAYNRGSLDDPRVRVTVADVREAIDAVGPSHAILSDLTFPSTPEDSELLAAGWFARLKSRLLPGGVLSLNAVSPDRTPSAYWSIYQSLRVAGLAALPGHYHLPSFAELGYGRWGFFLASDRAIQRQEIDGAWMECFCHPAAWAELRLQARPSDDGRALFAALLESSRAPAFDADDPSLDFLGFEDPSAVLPPQSSDPLQDDRLRAWLTRTPGSGIDDLLTAVPLSHRAVTRELVRDWAGYLIEALSTIDLKRLVGALIRRASALPARVVEELKRFRRLLARGLNPAEDLTTWGWRFFSVLMLVLVLSQTAMPTAAYAKGGSSFHGGSYIGTSPSGSYGGRSVFFGRGWGYRSHGGSGTSGTGSPEEAERMRKVMGGLLLAGGAAVAAASARRRED